MGDFVEAIVLLLPTDAGGRTEPIAPRDGSYRPFVAGGRVRFIEGPPTIAPGDDGRVVVEIETPLLDVQLAPGAELQMIDEEGVVGLLTVTRVWRRPVAVP
jgi:hypothetical protein